MNEHSHPEAGLQARYALYLRMGLPDRPADYIIWCNRMVSAYRKAHGLSRWEAITDHDALTNWMVERVETHRVGGSE